MSWAKVLCNLGNLVLFKPPLEEDGSSCLCHWLAIWCKSMLTWTWDQMSQKRQCEIHTEIFPMGNLDTMWFLVPELRQLPFGHTKNPEEYRMWPIQKFWEFWDRKRTDPMHSSLVGQISNSCSQGRMYWITLLTFYTTGHWCTLAAQVSGNFFHAKLATLFVCWVWCVVLLNIWVLL